MTVLHAVPLKQQKKKQYIESVIPAAGHWGTESDGVPLKKGMYITGDRHKKLE